MKGYADLLREAQARQDAERRADIAEAKLVKIEVIVNDAGYAGLPSNIIAVLRQILESDA